MIQDAIADAWQDRSSSLLAVIHWLLLGGATDNSTRIRYHTWLPITAIKNASSCRRRKDSDPYLIDEEVFRYLLKDLLIKATKHMLQYRLSFNLYPLGGGCASAYLPGNFTKARYFVVLHEVAILYQSLIMIFKKILKCGCEAQNIRFIAPCYWIDSIWPSAK